MIRAVYHIDPGKLTLDNFIAMAPGGEVFFKTQRALSTGVIQSEEEWTEAAMEAKRPNKEPEEDEFVR